MLDQEIYGKYETAWCPGCGNFQILPAVKKALAASDLAPHQVIFISGIGQAAKAPHYLNTNLFNGVHGRSLPVATGCRLANHQMPVIVESGDGCNYGEGGNHFLAAMRRNLNIVLLVHDNQVYGLTKGQASPTSDEGFVTKAQPHGVYAAPFNPIAVAVALQAGFVARSFAGFEDHLVSMITQALVHPGFALVDILQQCVSFNKINTFSWYKNRCYTLPESYDPTDWTAAMQKAHEWGDKIPVGVIYKNNRPPFEAHFDCLQAAPLVKQKVDKARFKTLFDHYK
jgi:2-oxoglutarate ferredoxin oxidoreductase subunit beta